jgi:hypothetical protein
LVEKDNNFSRRQLVVQEYRGEIPPSIVTTDASTITKATLVSSPLVDTSQEHLGELEKHTRGVDYKLLSQMGYHGQGLCKRRQRTLSPFVAMPRAKYEGLGFDGKRENSITVKTIFMKEKDMLNFSFSPR